MKSFYFKGQRKLQSFQSVLRGGARRSGLVAACTLAGLLSLPVCAQQAEQPQGERGTPVVVQPGAPGQPTRTLPPSTRATLPPRSPADVQFMQGMIMHHAQAVEMTALIESSTQNKELRLLGARISHSQSEEMKFMKRWLETRGEPTSLPMQNMRGMDMSMPGMAGMNMSNQPMLMPGMLTPKQMEALRKAKGAEFDQLFLTGMIQHDNGQRAEIRIMQNMLREKP